MKRDATLRRRQPKNKSLVDWQKSSRLQEHYASQLRAVARQIGHIVSAFDPVDWGSLPLLEASLRKYSEALEPWAAAVARKMIQQADRQDLEKWNQASRSMARDLRRELETTSTGDVQRQFMAEQVTLIKSLPLDAAKRVHEIVIENQFQGGRYDAIADKIRETGSVTASRATLIARTEISRVSTALTQARAMSVGSQSYIWHTANDADVRESHAKLNNTAHRWDTPPPHEEGGGKIYYSHPGAIFNCRCWPEPIIPDL